MSLAVSLPREDEEPHAPLRNRVEAATQGFEQAFLGLGERLFTCVRILGETRDVFASLSAAHETPDYARAEETIRALIAESGTLLEGITRERDVVGSLAKAVSKAAPPLDDLHRTVAMIEVIAINARVVAAGTLDNGDAELAVFTDDVVDLARAAFDIVRRLREGRTELRQLLKEALARVESYRDHVTRTNAQLRVRLEGDMAAADAERGKILAANAAALLATETFGGRVQEIVANLQVGDSTRQRLEHVSAALLMAEEDVILAPTLLALQSLQLCAARERLLAEATPMRRSLVSLSRDVSAMFRGLSGGLQGNRGSSRSAVECLAENVAITVGQLAKSEEERALVESLAQVLSERVRELMTCAEDMQALEFQMRLVSLNTAVTCARLGDNGRALAVASLQIRELVSEMVARSEAVAAPLEEVRALASMLVDTRKGEASASSLVRNAEESLNFLRNAEDRIRGAMRDVSDLGNEVARVAAEAGAALHRPMELADALADIEAELETAAAASGAATGETGGATALVQLRKAYTMQEERDVHDSFLGASSDHGPSDGHLAAARPSGVEAVLF